MNKVFITGGCGFIGSHLAELFVSKNFKVTVYDKYNIQNDLNNLTESKYLKKINIILGDIRDLRHLSNSMKGHDYVIHLAALIGIPYSYVAPSSYISTNINGTFNVLESCLVNKIKKTIVTSTSEVYGSGVKFPMTEEHKLNCQSPYSASKLAADNLAYSYYCSFNLPLNILRPFNVYGPRQSNRAVIPTIIQQAIFSEKIKIGNTKSLRDFTYVDDLCLAYFKMLNQNLFNGQIFNTGTGRSYSIEYIISCILSILRNNNKKIIFEKKRFRPLKSEVHKLLASTKKIKKLIRWHSKTSLQEGLKKTIIWQKNNQLNEVSKYRI